MLSLWCALALVSPACVLQPGTLRLDRDASAVIGLEVPGVAQPYATGTGSASGGVLGRAGRLEARPEWTVSEQPTGWTISSSVAGVAGGVKGIALAIRGVPDTLSIILPSMTGLCFTRDSHPSSYRAEWPITWEAAMVLLQGPDAGLLIMADDPALTFKAVSLVHAGDAWDITLESHNQAPFDALTSHTSVPWRFIPYRGDYREGARLYREWLARKHDLAGAEAAEPAWARDIRLVVTLAMDRALLAPLAKLCDPRQTLLYVPGWRVNEYDRNYPDYTPAEGFRAFIEEAHALGFRVMPHANYFGCDPKNPLYEKFRPYQLRDTQTGELLWWDWARAEPPIKFAYIHPGCSAWREELVSRLSAAHRDLGFDAVHIDQTLCVYNHGGGLVEGMSCAEGSLALHKALRDALPDVALSGEGLDEVTFVYEAFAQRHLVGFNHVDGTWDPVWLDRAHPISALLFSPHTASYGYLGMTSPSSDQAYAAWRQAYRRYNVIPTITWPSPASLSDPQGFWKLAFAEARAWQEHRLVPDMEGPLAGNVCYQYRGADGVRAAYLDESGTVLQVGDREVARTIYGVDSVNLPGSIAGARYYTADAIRGLAPERWYPYDPTPRSMAALHVEDAPAGASVTLNAPPGGYARIALADAQPVVLDTRRALGSAQCAVRVAGEEPKWGTGGIPEPAYGAQVAADGGLLCFHPAWGNDAAGKPVRGDAVVRYRLAVPAEGTTRFVSDVFIDLGAGDRTDGVVFTVTARADGGTDSVHAELATRVSAPQRLGLDLSRFAGRAVTLEIACNDGGHGDPSFDWARMREATVVCERRRTGELVIAGEGAAAFRGTDGNVTAIPERHGAFRLTMPFPGAVYAVPAAAAEVALPTDLASLPWVVSYRQEDGSDRSDPGQFAAMTPSSNTCGGRELRGLFTHPPDHGQIVLQCAVKLPAGPARFESQVGLRDGSKSDGVVFRVSAGGRQRIEKELAAGAGWVPIACNLSDLAGKVAVFELVVDSKGPHYFDWACWGEPKLTSGTAPAG